MHEKDISHFHYILVSANIKLSFIIDVRKTQISLLIITLGQILGEQMSGLLRHFSNIVNELRYLSF